MRQIEYFVNDNFKVLTLLYDMCDKQNKSHVTQQEIADELKLSRVTVNKIMRELKRRGYIELDGKHRGRCILTTPALLVVESFRKAEYKEI
jgi:biotin operon repressor